MAKDIYDKIEVILRIIKNNKWLLLFGFATLTGSNIGQYFYFSQPSHPIVKEKTIVNTTVKEINYDKVKLFINRSVKKAIKQHEKELH